MTEVSDAEARLTAAMHANVSTGDLDPGDVELVLSGLAELENSYVRHLPTETDTWLMNSQDITLEHPLPPESQVKFFYGPGRSQFLTARMTEGGLRVWVDHGHLALAPISTNVILITGSIQ